MKEWGYDYKAKMQLSMNQKTDANSISIAFDFVEELLNSQQKGVH